jgi:hypothetical protein
MTVASSIPLSLVLDVLVLKINPPALALPNLIGGVLGMLLDGDGKTVQWRETAEVHFGQTLHP